jgi:hypothetical protein
MNADTLALAYASSLATAHPAGRPPRDSPDPRHYRQRSGPSGRSHSRSGVTDWTSAKPPFRSPRPAPALRLRRASHRLGRETRFARQGRLFGAQHCNFLASTRAATVSASAQTREVDVTPEMPVAQIEQGSLDSSHASREDPPRAAGSRLLRSQCPHGRFARRPVAQLCRRWVQPRPAGVLPIASIGQSGSAPSSVVQSDSPRSFVLPISTRASARSITQSSILQCPPTAPLGLRTRVRALLLSPLARSPQFAERLWTDRAGNTCSVRSRCSCDTALRQQRVDARA